MYPNLTEETVMQTVQIEAYGKVFNFEIPLDRNDYEPQLDDGIQECVLLFPNGDIALAVE